tara:strand:- start:7455 stop:8327 length:873 start_codon:yes stop_codon:yes gene_type:complete
MKKYAICIPASNDFALATAVLIWSLEKNFKYFKDCDIIVPYNNLNDKHKKIISRAYPSVIFKKPKDSSFYDVIPKTIYGKDNYDVYLSFEAFSQEGYEKVIYFDADMLCVQDFSEIVDLKQPMAWCSPNLGILVVGKEHIPKTYHKLIDMVRRDSKIRNHPGGDQEAVRVLFRKSSDKIKHVSKDYNFQDWGGGGKGSDQHFLKNKDKVKVIHYSGRRKPWGKVWEGEDEDKNCARFPHMLWNSQAVKIWHDYYEQFKIYKMGVKLGPYEKYETKTGKIINDTPAGMVRI